MAKIIPAVMPDSFKDLENKIEKVDGFVSEIQVDLMDGVFVPSLSWPYNGEDLDKFEKMIKQEEGMPSWQKVNFTFDLMVSEVESKVYDWINLGASGVTLHLESLHNQENAGIVTKLKEEFGDDLQVGISIGTTTPNEKLEPFLSHVDFVQFMGIENIGYQGEDFDERVLEKISELKGKYPEMKIVVDGSVNEETIPSLLKAGADELVVGSALFEAKDIHDQYEKLSKLI